MHAEDTTSRVQHVITGCLLQAGITLEVLVAKVARAKEPLTFLSWPLQFVFLQTCSCQKVMLSLVTACLVVPAAAMQFGGPEHSLWGLAACIAFLSLAALLCHMAPRGPRGTRLLHQPREPLLDPAVQSVCGGWKWHCLLMFWPTLACSCQPSGSIGKGGRMTSSPHITTLFIPPGCCFSSFMVAMLPWQARPQPSLLGPQGPNKGKGVNCLLNQLPGQGSCRQLF